MRSSLRSMLERLLALRWDEKESSALRLKEELLPLRRAAALREPIFSETVVVGLASGCCSSPLSLEEDATGFGGGRNSL